MSGSRSTRAVGVRWTVGDVSDLGYEALAASILGARRVFGTDAAYTVVVNSVDVHEARRRVGEAESAATFVAAEREHLPRQLLAHLDDGMTEGTAWKLAPPRLFPERFELALDNDCILWAIPTAVRDWLEAGEGCLIAEDVRAGNGHFAALVDDAPRNSGIRGFPPGFDLDGAIAALLRAHPVQLTSELDEQGLSVALIARARRSWLVGLDDVPICSPFWPHRPELGRCGAHFVGLNVRQLPWSYYGRPASECVGEHWHRHRERVRALVTAESE